MRSAGLGAGLLEEQHRAEGEQAYYEGNGDQTPAYRHGTPVSWNLGTGTRPRSGQTGARHRSVSATIRAPQTPNNDAWHGQPDSQSSSSSAREADHASRILCLRAGPRNWEPAGPGGASLKLADVEVRDSSPMSALPARRTLGTMHRETIVGEFTHQADTFNRSAVANAPDLLDALVGLARPRP